MLPFQALRMRQAKASSRIYTTPTFIAAGGPTSQTNSPVTANYPTDVVAGDIAILRVLVSTNGTDTFSVDTPSGWNSITQQLVSGTGGLSFNRAFALFWRRIDGSEGGSISVSTTPSIPSTHTVTAEIVNYGGCLATGTPFEGLSVLNTTGASPQHPAVTTTGADRMIVSSFALEQGTAFTPNAAYTSRSNYHTTATPVYQHALTDRVAATATTYAAVSATATYSFGNRYSSVGFALLPQ